MLIFVASPYSADTLEERIKNVERSLRAGASILDRGHYPFLPLLNHYFDEYTQYLYQYDEYIDWGLEILARCDALLVLAPSPGVKIEVQFAKDKGIFIYTNLDDIPRNGIRDLRNRK